MENVITLRNLNKTYANGELEVKALKNINLTINRGEYIAIMGASGSGKSTLMNILGCLDRPTSGEYLLDGEDVSGLSDNELSSIRNRYIGFVFQSFNLIPRNSALRNVELPMLYKRELSAAKRQERALKLLEEVGLKERAEHMPNELSGGQRQRVAIARAMANDPPVIMADEPTGNLDTKSSIEIMEIFTRLNREKGATVIMVTHEPDIAAFTDRIITFRDGEIISDVKNEHDEVDGPNLSGENNVCSENDAENNVCIENDVNTEHGEFGEQTVQSGLENDTEHAELGVNDGLGENGGHDENAEHDGDKESAVCG